MHLQQKLHDFVAKVKETPTKRLNDLVEREETTISLIRYIEEELETCKQRISNIVDELAAQRPKYLLRCSHPKGGSVNEEESLKGHFVASLLEDYDNGSLRMSMEEVHYTVHKLQCRFDRIINGIEAIW